MLIIPLILATLLLGLWIVLLFGTNDEDLQKLAYNKIVDNRNKIEKLKLRDEQNLKKFENFSGLEAKIKSIFMTTSSTKEMAKLEKANQLIQSGNFKSLSVADLPGYVLFRRVNEKISIDIRKKVLDNCSDHFGKKHAPYKYAEMFAKSFSYALFFGGLCLAIGALLIVKMEEPTIGLGVLIVGTSASFLLGYLVYSDIVGKLNKKREAISRQFPEVVSKLALLVTSGMIMNQAWSETAYSDERELYKAMQKTSQELDNLISPNVAYSEFIRDCNTKETSKLASAIMQNLSKGNAEIGTLLKSMSKEAWSERRHTAKRDAEKARAKLLIPIMILLMDIILMIMIPMFANM